MFDEIDKKADKTNKGRPEKKIQNSLNKELNALSGHMLDDNYLNAVEKNTSDTIANTEKTEEFDYRMQELHNKGRKRGKRYSYVGLITSAVIMIVALAAGYLMYNQVKNISSAVNDDSSALGAIVDPDNLCNLDYCCLASLRRMSKNKFKTYNINTGCDEGYDMKELECENSLKWCEPGPALSFDCIEEGEMLSSMPLPNENKKKPACCMGLKTGNIFDLINNECLAILDVNICIDCPNGLCGNGENHCNCPEDCEIPTEKIDDTGEL